MPPETLLRDHVVARWRRTFEKVRGTFSAVSDTDARNVARWLTANARHTGVTEHELLEAMLESYWRQDWPKQHANRASLRNLYEQLDGLLIGLGKRAPRPRDRAFDPELDTPATAAEERLLGDWIALGCPVRRTA